MQDPIYERAQEIIKSNDQITTILFEMLDKANTGLGIKVNLQELVKTILLLPFKHAAFKGGGVKGTAYVGVNKVFERFGLIDQLETIIGASAGGLTAAFLGLGVNSEQIDTILSSFTADEVLDDKNWMAKFANFVKSHGFDTGEGLTAWFMGQLKELGINPDITFAEHQRDVDAGVANKKEIILIGTDITKGRRVIMSAKTMPDCRIADAVRISTSIPGFFNPIYVELDDNDNIIFDTDDQGRKHLRCSSTQDKNNPRQVCLVDGGLIDNIGNDLKNVMGIQNSLMAVFYLLKMNDVAPEEQMRLNEELNARCETFINANKQHILRKRDRVLNKVNSAVTTVQLTFAGDDESKQQHQNQRKALKAANVIAKKVQSTTKKQQELIQQKMQKQGASQAKKLSFFQTLKEKVSQVLGTVRKGQERNLEHGVAFIDPVPELSTIDFEKMQIPPIKEMAITNGMRGAIAMLLSVALPIYLQRQQDKQDVMDQVDVQRLPNEIASAHAEVLRLAPARWHKFMTARATSVFWHDGLLQMTCQLDKLCKLERCATEYFRYGFTNEITIHTQGEQAVLTVRMHADDVKRKHAKWVGRLGDLRRDHFINIDEATLRLDFRQTSPDDSVFTDPAFSTELISRMKLHGL